MAEKVKMLIPEEEVNARIEELGSAGNNGLYECQQLW